MEKLSNIVNRARTKIAQNRLEEVFDDLFEFVSNERDDCLDELIALFKRYNKLNSDKRLGIITYEDADVYETRITLNLLNFIRELENENRIIYGTSVKKDGQVEVLIEGDIRDFNPTRQENLKETIAAILKIESEKVEIIRIMKGSVIVKIRLPKDKDIELVALFNRQSSLILDLISDYNVKEVKLSKESVITSRPIQSKPVRIIERYSFEPKEFIESVFENNQEIIATAFQKVFREEGIKYIQRKKYNPSPFEINDFVNDAFLNLLEAIKKGKIKEPFEDKNLISYFLNTIRFRYLEKPYYRTPRLKTVTEKLDIELHTPILEPFEAGFLGYSRSSDKKEELWDKVLLGLELLKPKCSEIIKLRYLDNWSYSGLKEKFNFKNEDVARAKCSNCIKSLKKIIEEMK